VRAPTRSRSTTETATAIAVGACTLLALWTMGVGGDVPATDLGLAPAAGPTDPTTASGLVPADVSCELVRRAVPASAGEAEPGTDITSPAKVHVRVCRDLGDGVLQPFPGGLVHVTATGRRAPEWRHRLIDCAGAVFAVPAPITRLQFSASIYEPVAVALPTAEASGLVDLGTVVLATNARIVLRLWHPPPDLPRDLIAVTEFGNSFPFGRAPLGRRGDHLEAELPASTSTFCLQVTSERPGFVLNLPYESARRTQGLREGERREIDVDLAPLGRCAFRLEGVAPELRQHLEVRWYDSVVCTCPVRFDEQGWLRMLGVPRCDPPNFRLTMTLPAAFPEPAVRLRSHLGQVEFELAAGAVTIVEPEEPLVGIARRGDGELRPFRLGIDREPWGNARAVHFVSQATLQRARWLHLHDEAGELLVAAADLFAVGAMRWILPGTAGTATAIGERTAR